MKKRITCVSLSRNYYFGYVVELIKQKQNKIRKLSNYVFIELLKRGVKAKHTIN